MKRLMHIGILCVAMGFAFDCVKTGIVKESVRVSTFTDDSNLKPAILQLDENQVELAVRYRLDYHNQKLSDREVHNIVKVIYLGHTKYNINYLDVMSMISTESEWYKFAAGKNYKNYKKKKINGKLVKVLDSIDYGLTQQNSKSIKGRYSYASKVLKQLNIAHDKSNKYDVALNTMSCILYLSSIRKEIGNGYSHKRMIASYNTGVVGFKRWPKKATAYYQRFSKMKEI